MDNAVLLALTQDPQPVSAVAAGSGVPESDAAEALERLMQRYLAIAEDDGYELSGPLSWFGSFGGAVRYYARRNFFVSVPDEFGVHLFLCDVRVKDGRPAGDPGNTTVGVFACGRTARDVVQVNAGATTCEECRRAIDLYG